MNSFLSNVGTPQLRGEASSPYESPVCEAMTAIGLAFDRRLDTGVLFKDESQNLAVMVDLSICKRSELEYIDYTSVQNELMARCGRLLRFAVETAEDIPAIERGSGVLSH